MLLIIRLLYYICRLSTRVCKTEEGKGRSERRKKCKQSNAERTMKEKLRESERDKEESEKGKEGEIE